VQVATGDGAGDVGAPSPHADTTTTPKSSQAAFAKAREIYHAKKDGKRGSLAAPLKKYSIGPEFCVPQSREVTLY